MNKIVVSDTNIFIDLISVGLQEKLFLLPIEIHTTDMVIFEIKREGQSGIMIDLINKGYLNVKTYTSEEMLQFFQAGHRKYNLSLADYSVLTYSKENSYILLTCDGNLRKVALSEGVEVHGSIYIINMMADIHSGYHHKRKNHLFLQNAIHIQHLPLVMSQLLPKQKIV